MIPMWPNSWQTRRQNHQNQILIVTRTRSKNDPKRDSKMSQTLSKYWTVCIWIYIVYVFYSFFFHCVFCVRYIFYIHNTLHTSRNSDVSHMCSINVYSFIMYYVYQHVSELSQFVCFNLWHDFYSYECVLGRAVGGGCATYVHTRVRLDVYVCVCVHRSFLSLLICLWFSLRSISCDVFQRFSMSPIVPNVFPTILQTCPKTTRNIFQSRTKCIPRRFQEDWETIPLGFQPYFKRGPNAFQTYSECAQHVCQEFQRVSESVSNIRQTCFRCITSVFQDYSKMIPNTFQ